MSVGVCAYIRIHFTRACILYTHIVGASFYILLYYIYNMTLSYYNAFRPTDRNSHVIIIIIISIRVCVCVCAHTYYTNVIFFLFFFFFIRINIDILCLTRTHLTPTTFIVAVVFDVAAGRD